MLRHRHVLVIVTTPSTIWVADCQKDYDQGLCCSNHCQHPVQEMNVPHPALRHFIQKVDWGTAQRTHLTGQPLLHLCAPTPEGSTKRCGVPKTQKDTVTHTISTKKK